jgi:hypothetical protein
MSLVHPHFIALDSSTLGKVSRDFWSPEKQLREKARTFVKDLQDRNVFITLTLIHIIELLGSEDELIVKNRISFLRGLPFIAWLRPYERIQFPGSVHDLLLHELHSVIHAAKCDWKSIIDHVRTDIWATGIGCELFVNNDLGWSMLQEYAQNLQRRGQYVASVVRTDPGNVKSLTIADSKKMAKRPKEERSSFMRQFATTMKRQLDQHGDKRLQATDATAIDFAKNMIQDIQQFEAAGGDPIQRMFEYYGIPQNLVTDDMSVEDIGQLAVYVKQLNLISKKLHPQTTVTIQDIPIDTLPSYVLQQKLAKLQEKAVRVSGSDFGDSYIAPLILYADSVEVDKRTHEYLSQVQRSCPAIGSLMGHYFRSSDYTKIPGRCGI